MTYWYHKHEGGFNRIVEDLYGVGVYKILTLYDFSFLLFFVAGL